MARIKIDLPEKFHFSCELPIRITDINYGGHVGNDTVLTLVHEARMQFFAHFGYTELQFAGVGIIMADASLEFKNELFYGEIITVSVAAAEFSKVSFDVFYKLETFRNDKKIIVALAKTGIVCYDYEKKKIVAVPHEALKKLQ
jgi:acyl-CoA thioester hydrolase